MTVPVPLAETDEDPEFRFGTPASELFNDPAGYDPGEELRAAIRVALLLGMPLLLTGEPGCGKTSVAHWVAWRLKLGAPLVYNVKSTSIGRDLLYRYDDLGRFRDVQLKLADRPPQAHLTLNALGLAILLSTDPKAALTPSGLHAADLLPNPARDPARFGKRCIVLIDELDKAPRDTPNDLLLEVDQLRFRIPELDLDVVGRPDMRPFVVITSNSEKNLPAPFLRRCVFHHIDAPNDERRRGIVALRKHPLIQRGSLFEEAMQYFDRVSPQLSRKPGNAELLAWLTALEDHVARTIARHPAHPLATLAGSVRDTLGVIAKTEDDRHTANQVLDDLGLS